MARRLCTGSLLLVIFVTLLSSCQKGKLEWKERESFRYAALSVPKGSDVGFNEIPVKQSGVLFSNSLTREQIMDNRNLLNGSGVAVGDVDGDGWVDLYFCRLNGPNVLYRNLGDWKFEDFTKEAGVACPDQFSTGTAFVDVDGDRDLDLLVLALGGPNTFFLNDGSGKFTEVTKESGLAQATGATSMAWADIDGDGDLDLYVANYKRVRAADKFQPSELSFIKIVEKVGSTYRIAAKFRDDYSLLQKGDFVFSVEDGEPDVLFLNDGEGHFSANPLPNARFQGEDGRPVSGLRDWGLMVRFQDADQDGDPDLYVCNDFDSPDRIWLNDGKGYFRAAPRIAIRKTSNSSMAVDFSDVDRDGDLDFYLVEMLARKHQDRMAQLGNATPVPLGIGEIDNRPQYMRNMLFLNRGDNTYAEIAQFSGVQASDWSWSTVFLDVDLDGYEDILTTNGHYYNAQDADAGRLLNSKLEDYRSLIFTYPGLKLVNAAFRNRGDLTFEEVGEKWGFESPDISHGMALGDLDNDGDLDLVINRFDTPAGLYRNDSSAPRVAVRLRGLVPNTQGVGATIRVLGDPRIQSKEVLAGGFYLSGSGPTYTFASKSEIGQATIDVTWRSGLRSVVQVAEANRLYEIYESAAQPGRKWNASWNGQPNFKDLSHLIDHTHHEEPFDDFKRQPLLPNRLSQLGPGIAWHDLDQDGDDDLIIGSGRGGPLSWFRNNGGSGFQRISNSSWSRKNDYDQTSVLGWTAASGAAGVLAGLSSFEARGSLDVLFRFYPVNGPVAAIKTPWKDGSSVGPMALADYDGDHDLDLFLGGRSIPGRYPQPASSWLFRYENSEFVLDEANSGTLQAIGLVSGAVFSDLDGDADPELVLAMEWGPVRVYRNVDGTFMDATGDLGLLEYRGWWNGVTTGDLDSDGRLDIIATNWGLNTKYQTEVQQLYYDDFDLDGTLDVIEGHFEQGLGKNVPERGLMDLAGAMPFIGKRVSSFKKYGESGIYEIIGPKFTEASKLEANTLAHMVFFNRGDHFEAQPLPREAQFSPAFYVGVADFDNDGSEDVFLSQNFFATQPQAERNDAGRGLWLKGDGAGALLPMPGHVTGVMVYGEQRGAALGDYNRDGRVDLVVTQNGAETKLYENISPKPGFRVRLQGPSDNSTGVGAVIRLARGTWKGPAREVHAGSGYWSQDSAIQVFGRQPKPDSIWVRWPGGRVTMTAIPDSVIEVTVSYERSPRATKP